MRKIGINNTYEIKNSDLCVAREYPFGDKDIDIATATINGRYPDNGYCVNTKVKEMIFVIQGEGTLFTEVEEIHFSAGDAILINKKEKYYWDAHCKVAMACTPAWYAKQHKVVEK